jgi:hypothetical protein
LSVVGNAAEEGAPPDVQYLDTDGKTEAMLDTIEAQIYEVLHFAPSGALFRSMGKGMAETWHSEAHRSGEEDIRLARRKITAGFRLKETYLDPGAGDCAGGARALAGRVAADRPGVERLDVSR